jgi:hypothetical protein
MRLAELGVGSDAPTRTDIAVDRPRRLPAFLVDVGTGAQESLLLLA